MTNQSIREAPVAEPEIGSGQGSLVAEGAHWLRMPLGGGLDAINIWALEDGDGWTVVDTGMRTSATLEAWRRATVETFGDRPIRRAIITHMHPDHAGMAGWLHGHFQTQLWMTRLEYYMLRMLVADTGNAPEEAVAFFRSTGLDERWLEEYRLQFGAFGRRLYPLPVQFRAIEEGEEIVIGSRAWRVVTGSGHSPEHASLWAPDDRLLISGDQVLPTISSNVSVQPYEPNADPLSDWLNSLRHIRSEVPDDVMVLPAHGRPFYGLHARLDTLISRHEEGLERLREMLATPQRAVDVFPALFRRQIADDFTRMLAVGEAMAHLSCLLNRGRARSWLDDHGVRWWQQA